MLGCNDRTPIIIREIDKYVAQGSYLKIVSTFDHAEKKIRKLINSLKNIKLEFMHADTSSREVIEELNISSFDSIQLLSYKNELEVQDADTQTLISLLNIRKIIKENKIDIKIVSEMLDLKNRELVEVSKTDDFIVSDNLVSLLLSQVSENKNLMRIFENLFDEEGSEIYLKPVKEYIKPLESVNFYTIIKSAINKGHTAIGYKIGTQLSDTNKNFEIILNPDKAKLITFGENDEVIVLSKD